MALVAVEAVVSNTVSETLNAIFSQYGITKTNIVDYVVLVTENGKEIYVVYNAS